MNEQEIKHIIEKTKENSDNRAPEKIHYMMDFGDFTIQYEFSIN